VRSCDSKQPQLSYLCAILVAGHPLLFELGSPFAAKSNVWLGIDKLFLQKKIEVREISA